MTLEEHGQNEIHKKLSNTIASCRSMEIHHWDLISQICVGSHSWQEILRVKAYPRLALLYSSIVCGLMLFAWETSPTLKNALSYLFIYKCGFKIVGGKYMPFMTTQLPLLQQSWTSWNVDVQGISEKKGASPFGI